MKLLDHILVTLLSCVGVIALVIWGLALFYPHLTITNKVTCKNFRNQRQAQQLYNKDEIKYASLDRDQDGHVCESLVP